MGRAVSDLTFEGFVGFMLFVKDCPGGNDWLEHFDEYREHRQAEDTCLKRMKKFAQEYNAKIIRGMERIERER